MTTTNHTLLLESLQKEIYEKLPHKEAEEFSLKFKEALSTTDDLSTVWDKFALWLLGDTKDGVIQYTETDQQRKVIQDVIDLYERKLSGEDVTEEEWRAAADAAAAAVYAAVYADAAVYAAVYADAAVYAAADAVYAAVYAAAAARQNHYKKMADKLIEILEDEQS